MRVLEIGAAKCWGAQHVIPRGCEYVGTDILADPKIGLGRGAFYEERVGRPFLRVQADGESLPFASGSFDVAYCVATLHHALDLGAMVRELARVTRPGGHVLALNEGTRAVWRRGTAPDQAEELTYGINEHVHTLYGYLWAFARAGLVVRRVEQADGYEELAGRRIGGALLQAAARRPQRRDLVHPVLLRLPGRQPRRAQARGAALTVSVQRPFGHRGRIARCRSAS